MFTASAKKKENIAEYLLYMWQIEDIIRASQLDIDRIQHEIIDQYSGLTDEQRKQLRDWYESLIDMMRTEGVTEKGHLQINKTLLLSLPICTFDCCVRLENPSIRQPFTRHCPIL